MFFNLPWRLAPLWTVQEIEELLLKETTKHKAGILRGRSFCQVVFLHIVHCEWYLHQEGALDCVRSQQPGCLRPLPSLLSDAWDPVPYLHIQQSYPLGKGNAWPTMSFMQRAANWWLRGTPTLSSSAGM